MQKYINSIASKTTGLPLAGLSVQVNLHGGAAATIYSDNGVTTTSNPLTTDVNGAFEFYAADARYDIVISGSGFTTQTISDVILEDPAAASALVVTTLTLNADAGGNVVVDTLAGVMRMATGGAVQVKVALNAAATRNVLLSGSTTDPLVDTSAGALQLKSGGNNALNLTGGTINSWAMYGNSAGNRIGLNPLAASGDTDVGLQIGSKGAGDIVFFSNTDSAALPQFQIVRTAGSTRFPVVTGSAAGNPKIYASGGALDLFGAGGSGAFFGGTGGTKPTVTGSRGGNAALASLLTALATLGLLTDSSS